MYVQMFSPMKNDLCRTKSIHWRSGGYSRKNMARYHIDFKPPPNHKQYAGTAHLIISDQGDAHFHSSREHIANAYLYRRAFLCELGSIHLFSTDLILSESNFEDELS